MPHRYTYSRTEKLKGRKTTEMVFKKGKSFLVFPVKVFYINDLPDKSAVLKAGVGAGSRNFKKAVDRNRIKRLLREAYRLEKPGLKSELENRQRQMGIFLLYIGKELPEIDQLKEKMPQIIENLIKRSYETTS